MFRDKNFEFNSNPNNKNNEDKKNLFFSKGLIQEREAKLFHDIKNNLTLLNYIELFSNKKDREMALSYQEFMTNLRKATDKKNKEELEKLKQDLEYLKIKFLKIKNNLVLESDKETLAILDEIEKNIENTTKLIEEYIKIKNKSLD
ncbi:MAG: hypothetical protein N3D10_03450 [Candidatus Micrarchaeota archaeon]|nr:hypothetical protein [Candidatus Micrarchaeota archaeon]